MYIDILIEAKIKYAGICEIYYFLIVPMFDTVKNTLFSQANTREIPLDSLLLIDFTSYMGGIISSNVLNYTILLEATFQEFLLSAQTLQVTIKNYLADLRNFFAWLATYLTNRPSRRFASHSQLLRLVTPEVIENYKHDQLVNHTPASTINRRLSTLRTFFRCAVSHGWVDENSAELVQNVKKTVIQGPLGETNIQDSKKTEPTPEAS